MSVSKIFYLFLLLSIGLFIGCSDDEDSCDNCGEVNVERMNDSLVLVDLYNSTDGSNWTNRWDLSMGMGTWGGITLKANGTVDRIELQENNLVGTIPSSIITLTDPTVLEIRFSDLSGELPSGLDQLKNLKTLRLNGLGLTGSIPQELTNLQNIEILQLSRNNLTGNIPDGFGALANMDYLDLAENNLTGGIPADFGNFTNVFGITVSQNDLSGCFPTELMSHCNSSSFSSYLNFKMPFEGLFDKFCNGLSQIGAPCKLDGVEGTIDADCNCVI